MSPSTWMRSRAHVLRTVVLLASELPRLVVLFALTATAFAGTRWFAVRERATQLSDAREWLKRGEQALAAGYVERTVADFRALVATSRLDEAERVLGQLRQRSPDNITTNVLLARVAARRGDTAGAMGSVVMV